MTLTIDPATELAGALAAFLLPILDGLASGEPGDGTWEPGGPWRPGAGGPG